MNSEMAIEPKFDLSVHTDDVFGECRTGIFSKDIKEEGTK